MTRNPREVMIVDTGKVYPNISAMAEDLGLTESNLYRRLRGERPNGGGLSMKIAWVDHPE